MPGTGKEQSVNSTELMVKGITGTEIETCGSRMLELILDTDLLDILCMY
jgi:hypothetical protein